MNFLCRSGDNARQCQWWQWFEFATAAVDAVTACRRPIDRHRHLCKRHNSYDSIYYCWLLWLLLPSLCRCLFSLFFAAAADFCCCCWHSSSSRSLLSSRISSRLFYSCICCHFTAASVPNALFLLSLVFRWLCVCTKHEVSVDIDVDCRNMWNNSMSSVRFFRRAKLKMERKHVKSDTKGKRTNWFFE